MAQVYESSASAVPILYQEPWLILPGAELDENSGLWYPSDRLRHLTNLIRPDEERWWFLPDPIRRGWSIGVCQDDEEEFSVYQIDPSGQARPHVRVRTKTKKHLKIKPKLRLKIMPDGWLVVGDLWVGPDGTVIREPLLNIDSSYPIMGRSILLPDGLVVERLGQEGLCLIRELNGLSLFHGFFRLHHWDDETMIATVQDKIVIQSGSSKHEFSARGSQLFLPDGFWLIADSGGLVWGYRDALLGNIQLRELGLHVVRDLAGVLCPDGWVIVVQGQDLTSNARPIVLRFRNGGKDLQIFDGVALATRWFDWGHYRILLQPPRTLYSRFLTVLDTSAARAIFHAESDHVKRIAFVGKRIFINKGEHLFILPDGARLEAWGIQIRQDGVLLWSGWFSDQRYILLPNGDPDKAIQVRESDTI